MPISVNGMIISDDDIRAAAEDFDDAPNPLQAAARALAVRALLRQRAAVLGIDGEDEASTLEALLDREVKVPEISEAEIQRYFDGNRQKFRSGDLFEARHILFDTLGEDQTERVRKAEAMLLLLKDTPERFEALAKESSACSSGKIGGQLGQLSHGSVVPEFWQALVAQARPGLLPHLVPTRYGHHIIIIDRCAMGQPLPFEAVRAKITDFLASRIHTLAHQQYIATLIEHAEIRGVDFSDQRKQPAGPGLPIE